MPSFRMVRSIQTRVRDSSQYSSNLRCDRPEQTLAEQNREPLRLQPTLLQIDSGISKFPFVIARTRSAKISADPNRVSKERGKLDAILQRTFLVDVEAVDPPDFSPHPAAKAALDTPKIFSHLASFHDCLHTVISFRIVYSNSRIFVSLTHDTTRRVECR